VLTKYIEKEVETNIEEDALEYGEEHTGFSKMRLDKDEDR
jgi:hypothetical protein